jgi:hypothetical protein
MNRRIKKIMNKIKVMLVMIVMALLVMPGLLQADDYTVDITTFDVKGSVADFAKGEYPNIAGGYRIDQIVLSNDTAVAQTISIYDTATSTTNAVLVAKFQLPATIGDYIIQYPYYNALTGANFAIKKSSASSNVQLNIQYR